VYDSKALDSVGWFQVHAERSLRLIRETSVPPTAAIIHVGGGASMLFDDLLQVGYENLTVLDVSETALSAARSRLGSRGRIVDWRAVDITAAKLPVETYDRPQEVAQGLQFRVCRSVPGGHQ
jgi:hypothetical protein